MGFLSERDSVCVYAAYKESGLWSTLTPEAQTPGERSQVLPCLTLKLDHKWPNLTKWQVFYNHNAQLLYEGIAKFYVDN